MGVLCCAILLLMATTLFPHAAEGQSYSTEAHAILDDMIYRGNRLATARKTELTHLEGLFRELGARIERRGLQTLTLASPDHNIGFFTQETGEDATLTDPATLTPSLVGDADCSPSGLPPIASNLEFLENIGISSDEFLSIVNQIGNPVSHSVLDPGQARNQAILLLRVSMYTTPYPLPNAHSRLAPGRDLLRHGIEAIVQCPE